VELIYRIDPHAPLIPRKAETVEEAIKLLIDGNERHAQLVDLLRKEVLEGTPENVVTNEVNPLSLGLPLFQNAPAQQLPFAVVLGCSDARAPIEVLFDRNANDLFVVRVAGNVLGLECLGSLSYAVEHLYQDLQVVVVLGHTGCGAVTAAVDTYCNPDDYSEIGSTFAVRSLLDRIQVAARSAASSLQRVHGEDVKSNRGYREALIEVAVYFNAAITAFDIQRELAILGRPNIKVVYGIYDLVSQRVRSTPDPTHTHSEFADVSRLAEEFNQLGDSLAKAVKNRL